MYPLLVIVGPTAVGKTDFSLAMSQKIRGEIISADSMQIYQHMSIGTAKPSREEMKLVPHHMIDCVQPDEEFTVADFQNQVENLIPRICRRKSLPMLVGGTGLYVQAVLEGFIFPQMITDWDYRHQLHELAKKEGNHVVHERLEKIDPELAAKLHPNDLRRVIRGLEVYQQTGKTPTYFHERAASQPPRYKTIKLGLTRNRAELYQRINQRVEMMINEGLVGEVRALLQDGYTSDLTSMQGLGYKEIVGYLEGEYDLAEAIYLLKRNTRHFAKRQITWFKRDSEIVWLNLDQLSIGEMLEKAIKIIDEDFIFQE